ncbi:hypothetical protein [Methylobacterium marchantiae]|uniref:Uncharacterized protein n=1 Tax=Methylobacterium marchantiae TaxID=600331 RepID=A0ABW3WYZ8_9HYPH|nr:hypothetical protein AIGOOFII_2332 [Methylobacterium marchantiae]
MTRLARLFHPSSRLRAACGRLQAAETGFERSMTDLRQAALDHIARQHLLGMALRATLQRPASHGAGGS